MPDRDRRGWMPAPLRRAAGRLLQAVRRRKPDSHGYELLHGPPTDDLLRGWQAAAVARRQQAAIAPSLRKLRSGQPREDFATLAQAVKRTRLRDPLILEVGCGSGWNAEVLERLLGRPVRYVGVDFSPPMTVLARKTYPTKPFVVGHALRLPIREGAFDIAVSGTVLMHLPDYASAIRECRRVTRAWCLFHGVTVVQDRPTALLRKYAYGQPVPEVVINEGELRRQFQAHGLHLEAVYDNFPYDLHDVLGHHTQCRSYLCRLRSNG